MESGNCHRPVLILILSKDPFPDFLVPLNRNGPSQFEEIYA